MLPLSNSRRCRLSKSVEGDKLVSCCSLNASHTGWPCLRSDHESRSTLSNSQPENIGEGMSCRPGGLRADTGIRETKAEAEAGLQCSCLLT